MDPMDRTVVKIKQEHEDFKEDSPDLVRLGEFKNVQLNKFELVSTEDSFPNNQIKHEIDLGIKVECEDTENMLKESKIKIEKEDDDANAKDKSETTVNNPKSKQVKCELCGMMCRDSGRYKLHMMNHTGERPFKCDKCDKGYKKARELSYHMKTHTGEHDIRCGTCGKGFAVKSALRVHMRTHSKEKPFVCLICNRGFSQKANLKSHITTHGEEFPFECDQCDKKFRSKNALTHHKRNHEGDTGFQCAVCSRCYKSKDGLKEHMRKHQMPENKDGELQMYTCEQCGNTYKHSKSLKNHLRRHNDDMFCCDTCGKSYVVKNNSPTVVERTTFGKKGKFIHVQARQVIANVTEFMKSEARLYLTKRPLKIPLANYKQRVIAATGMSEDKSLIMAEHPIFGKDIHSQTREFISNLTAFMKSEAELYETTKEYKLPLSRYRKRVIESTGVSEGTYRAILTEAADIKRGVLSSFPTPRKRGRKLESYPRSEEQEFKDELRVHQRIHTGETPYECTICKKKFKRRVCWLYHKATHQNDRKIYECDMCDKVLLCKTSIQAHKAVVHSTETPFQCYLCYRLFKLRCDLTRHLRKHKEDDENSQAEILKADEVKQPSTTKFVKMEANDNFIDKSCVAGNNTDKVVNDISSEVMLHIKEEYAADEEVMQIKTEGNYEEINS